jgi:hypothetical protein
MKKWNNRENVLLQVIDGSPEMSREIPIDSKSRKSFFTTVSGYDPHGFIWLYTEELDEPIGYLTSGPDVSPESIQMRTSLEYLKHIQSNSRVEVSLEDGKKAFLKST